MKLEQQVCSLELANRLHELKVKQKSWYFWRGVSNNTAPEPEKWYYSWSLVRNDENVPEHFNNARIRHCAAFTVAELEQVVPTSINIAYKNGKPREENHYRSMTRISRGYSVAFRHRSYSSDSWIEVRGDTFADAFAATLIYLIENKLITL